MIPRARPRTPLQPAGLEPVPVPGCRTCAGWARVRELHRAAGNAVGVRACNALIAGHVNTREHPPNWRAL